MGRRTQTLTEYTPTFTVPLSSQERDALRSLMPSMTITPSRGDEGFYDLTPGPTVGVVRVGNLTVEVKPRLPIDRVLFLVSYALDPKRWHESEAHLDEDTRLCEAIIPVFTHHTNRLLRRGLLSGYQTLDESAQAIRGRIRFADQMRRQRGLSLPVEITYDEFTADIVENQLLLAAVNRLLSLPLRADKMRLSLIELRSKFEGVSVRPFSQRRIPEPTWTRLNERYRTAVSLARLILASEGLDVRAGGIVASAVLFDMTKVFENFVVVALREALRASVLTFPQGAAGRSLFLDKERGVRLKPDLSWWSAGSCVFVGDCKYKPIKTDGVPIGDLYQLLAYTTVLDLEEGLLVYAAGEYPPGSHTVVHAGKRLNVTTLDLGGPPNEVLKQIEALADRIRLSASGRLAA